MGIARFFKKVTGIQAYQDRKEAKEIKELAEARYIEASEITEMKRNELNSAISSFGELRLRTLKNTVGVFLSCLKDMEQKNKEKQYDILYSIDIKQDKVKELEDLEMSATQILGSTAASAAVGAVALTGVPTLVTSAVTALATASTGTAISSLSGVAATNAVLAWLGGGAISAGGAGMAGGALVLSAVTWSATGGMAILVAGLVASAHYSKKLTEAKEFKRDVDIKIGEMEKSWVVMGGIKKRVDELADLTTELTERSMKELDYLLPLVPDFDSTDSYHAETWQKNALLVKSIGELAKTSILDDNGDLTEASGVIAGEIRSLLNTQLN